MRVTLLIALSVLLMTAPVAVARQLSAGGSPAEVQVGKETVRPAAATVDPAAATRPSARRVETANGLQSRIGGLPLTGIDLLVISGAALVMTGIGFGMQRMSAPRL
jgi:hypothetical protein